MTQGRPYAEVRAARNSGAKQYLALVSRTGKWSEAKPFTANLTHPPRLTRWSAARLSHPCCKGQLRDLYRLKAWPSLPHLPATSVIPSHEGSAMGRKTEGLRGGP